MFWDYSRPYTLNITAIQLIRCTLRTGQCCNSTCLFRFMVGCGRCDDWFHGDCIGLDLAKVQQMEKDDQEFVCLKCCADEAGKGNTENSDNNSASDQKQGPESSVTSGGIRPFRKVRLLFLDQKSVLLVVSFIKHCL